MLELNGFKYSKERIEDYKFRAIAEFEKDKELYNLDIYTTDSSKVNVGKILKKHVKEGVEYIGLIHWCSKEQDDKTSDLIDEWLNEA
jgi:hypothetical protein|tara:strand:- start:2 stop:262 length:261 start_codon:yes stop_codon:yes gene_type:complete